MLPSSSSSSFTMPPPPPAPYPKPKRQYNHHHQQQHQQQNNNYYSSSHLQCNHSPSAILDLIILILVLFSVTFLVTSTFSHIFHLLPSLPPLPYYSSFNNPIIPYLIPLLILSILLLLAFFAELVFWSRKCGKKGCRGMKKAVEFDVKLETEEGIRERGEGWREIEELPWKGGMKGTNPDYDCLRAELRRMAPVNGRAVLLFRSRCGCPVAKLEAWGPKQKGGGGGGGGPRQRHTKKSTANLAIERGDR